MRHGQSPSGIAAAVLTGLEKILIAEKPDLVLVHGDTTTTFAAAAAAFYQQIPCGHVEAGLRTGNKYSPFPEEMNRRLTSVIADYHFAPTAAAKSNLLMENVAENHIAVTGNTVIDALLEAVKTDCDLASYGLEGVDWQKRIILLTCHRRESWGKPMEDIFAAVLRLTEIFENIEIVFPVHKNPLVFETAARILGGRERIHLCEPLDYLPFSHLMNRCYLILTDSGGMQEEAPALGKPVLVLRALTERPEAVKAGTARLTGVRYEDVFSATAALLRSEREYAVMAQSVNPFGDGTAAGKIADAVEKWLAPGKR
jgi:UDP-N-acetylglucosamine 2-epimerase (non-hydrolysing)